jgi:hypothetical protein
MSEVIMVLEEPWYNTLTEQMFEQVIEEIQPEPFIVSSELDNEINKAVLSLIMKLIRQFWIYFTIHMKALG